MSNSRHRMAWWARAVRSFGMMTGIVAAVAGADVSVTPAQDAGYRSAAASPAEWQAFAKELQGRFEQRLAADDDGALRMQDAMVNVEKQSAETLVVRAWISPNGKIERLEFDGFDDAEVAVNLRALLANVAVGVPPADMLQPLHLRLSLRPSDQLQKDR